MADRTPHPAPHYPDDEISLRDLYLIVKRGLPLILMVMVVAAVGAYLYLVLQGPRYQAETTVVINPTPVRVQGDARLALDQANNLTFQTYERLAFSRGVLEATLERLNGEGDFTVTELDNAGELERLAGPSNPNEVAAMTVSHGVVHSDPEFAATVADAWAQATVETVRASMTASLEPIIEATSEQLRSTESRLEELEAAWLEFQERDETGFIQAQLDGLEERVPRTEERLSQIERRLASARGARQVLANLQGSTSTSAGTAQGAVALLQPNNNSDGNSQASQETGADEADTSNLGEGLDARTPPGLDSETIAELTAVLEQTGVDEEVDLVSLVRQVELQRLTSEAAGLMSEQEATEQQLDGFIAREENLRNRLASLQLERGRLENQLNSARTTHQDLSTLEPILEYVNQLAPANSRIIDEASTPTDTVGPSRLLVSLLAAMVAGLLALLFVFLRAAVAEPAPAGPGRRTDPDRGPGGSQDAGGQGPSGRNRDQDPGDQGSTTSNPTAVH